MHVVAMSDLVFELSILVFLDAYFYIFLRTTRIFLVNVAYISFYHFPNVERANVVK